MATDINYQELAEDMQQRGIKRVYVNDDETYATYRRANAQARKAHPVSLAEVKERAGMNDASVPRAPSTEGDTSGGDVSEATEPDAPDNPDAEPEAKQPQSSAGGAKQSASGRGKRTGKAAGK